MIALKRGRKLVVKEKDELLHPFLITKPNLLSMKK